MDWGSLVGPAVVAAGVSGIITTIGFFITRSTSLTMHQQKLDADRDLAERKVNADIALAEKKLALDRTLADWKRRTELAEQLLSDFYKARDIFLFARSPFAFGGEGKTRPRKDGETQDEARYRDSLYAPYERLTKERDFLSELHARRYRAMALFGDQAAQPFLTFTYIYNRIEAAIRALINDRGRLSDDRREQYENEIWTTEQEDRIKGQLDQAVAAIEAMCQPVLRVQAA